MTDKKILKIVIEKVIWKGKQKYSQIRCQLGGGQFIWNLDDHVNFVSYKDDLFSHVLYVCRGHEKIEIDWCERWLKLDQSPQSVVDCGANIGYFSAVLAQRCSLGKILAIEGNQRTAKLCEKTFDILNLKNGHVVKAILSENNADWYSIPDRLGREPWQNAVKVAVGANDIQTTTLDQVVSDFRVSPSLVKIDCEGFEPLILRGATYLLNSIRPAFMIECNDSALELAGTNRHELFNLLRQCDYKLFHLASFTGFYPLGIEIDNAFPSSEFNFVAIPCDQNNLERWNQTIHPFC